jgi:hypothetical protein
VRKAILSSVLAKAGPGIRLNEHMEGDGETVFRHARKMGREGNPTFPRAHAPRVIISTPGQPKSRPSSGSVTTLKLFNVPIWEPNHAVFII